jgi:peptide/nickel transport system substrate-binding protein
MINPQLKRRIAMIHRKMTRRKFLKYSGATVLASTAAVGMSDLLLKVEAAEKKELRIGYPWDLKTLDPAYTTLGGDNAVQANIFDALLGYKPGTTDLVPEAATRWEIAQDNQSATFQLRKGIKWHKGYGELKAGDVKYHVERIINPQTASVYKGLFSVIKAVEVIDDYSLRVVLDKPNASFIYLLSSFRAGHIGCPRAIEEMGDDFAFNPVGSGPWEFDHWRARTEYVLKANPAYWGGAPRLNKITFLPIPEQVTMFSALKKGDIDMMFIDDVQYYQSAQEISDLKVMRFPSLFMFHLTFNTSLAPVDDVKVRQAIAYAINKKDIIEHVYMNLVTPLKCHLADGYFGSTADGVNQYEYNPQKSKEMLKETGYGDLKLKAVFPTIQKAPDVYTVVQSQLAEVGIELKLEQLEFGAWFQYIRSEKGEKEYHMSWNPIGPRPPDGDYPLTIFYHSASFPPGINHCRYKGADQLIEAQRVVRDPVQRKKIFADIMRKMSEDCPAIPLYSKDYMYAAKKKVKGVNTGPGVGELELSLIELG